VTRSRARDPAIRSTNRVPNSRGQVRRATLARDRSEVYFFGEDFRAALIGPGARTRTVQKSHHSMCYASIPN
jgi:hypothetical protein